MNKSYQERQASNPSTNSRTDAISVAQTGRLRHLEVLLACYCQSLVPLTEKEIKSHQLCWRGRTIPLSWVDDGFLDNQWTPTRTCFKAPNSFGKSVRSLFFRSTVLRDFKVPIKLGTLDKPLLQRLKDFGFPLLAFRSILSAIFVWLCLVSRAHKTDDVTFSFSAVAGRIPKAGWVQCCVLWLNSRVCSHKNQVSYGGEF